MSERPDGGPAFPKPAFDNRAENAADTIFHQSEDGMSLRDWFAGQAMAAIIIGNEADLPSMTAGAAKDAYSVADAMLAERRRSLTGEET